MGYFPNGTSGEMYEELYCSRCANQRVDDGGCAIWFAHFMRNYDECNNKESILNMLIPRTVDGLGNEQCLMFLQKQEPASDALTPDRARRMERTYAEACKHRHPKTKQPVIK